MEDKGRMSGSLHQPSVQSGVVWAEERLHTGTPNRKSILNKFDSDSVICCMTEAPFCLSLVCSFTSVLMLRCVETALQNDIKPPNNSLVTELNQFKESVH